MQFRLGTGRHVPQSLGEEKGQGMQILTLGGVASQRGLQAPARLGVVPGSGGGRQAPSSYRPTGQDSFPALPRCNLNCVFGGLANWWARGAPRCRGCPQLSCRGAPVGTRFASQAR